MTADTNTIPASDEKEINRYDTGFRHMLREIKGQKGYIVDAPLLEKAYAKAKYLHKDVRRHSGELYLCHPLAVAKTLTKLHCKTSVIAAGLLHDTLEDCDYTYDEMRGEFSLEIADIVQAVTAVKEEEASLENTSPEYRHQFLDLLTDAKLIKSHVQHEALLVRMADREHNLATLDACRPDKRRLKVQQTMQFLIPAAKALGMQYFAVSLSDYCMKYESLITDALPDLFPSDDQNDCSDYGLIVGLRNEITKVSWHTYGEFDSVLGRGVQQSSFFEFSGYNPFARLRGAENGLLPEHRRIVKPYEIAEQLPAGFPSFLRQDVYLNEFVLTYKDDSADNPLSLFIGFHKKYMAPYGINFRIAQNDSKYGVKLVLTDTLENNYCIRIIPESALIAYYIGDSKLLPGGSRGWAKDATRPKIHRVCSFSTHKGLKEYIDEIPQGATVLDFAFAIKPSLAFTVTGAKIKHYSKEGPISFSDADYDYPLETVLHDGDVVHFSADYYPDKERNVDHSKIEWFSNVTTETAKMALIEHFRAKIKD